MAEPLEQRVRELVAARKTPGQIRLDLLNQGFLPAEIDASLEQHAQGHAEQHTREERANAWLVTSKELLDRIGYGFGNNQFINILFYLLTSNLLLVGLFVPLKAVLSMLLSSATQAYAAAYRTSRTVMSGAGVLFGFSFLFLAFGKVTGQAWLFILALLLGSLGVVAYGDLYHRMVRDTIRRERAPKALRWVWSYGILVSAAAMVAAAWLMDLFPTYGSTTTFTLFSTTINLHLYGYVLAFLVTALAFILSGYVLSYVRSSNERPTSNWRTFWQAYRDQVRSSLAVFKRSRYVQLLLIASLLTGLAQVFVSAFAGIFIFETFRYEHFQGFMNVAAVYAPAVLIAFIGPYFSRRVHRSIGLSPTLVFGTLLSAFLPAILYFKPYLPNIIVANVCAVIGAAMVGISQDLLTKKLLAEHEREQYFRAASIVVALPYLLLIPVGAWAVATFGMQLFFVGLAVLLACVVAPLYVLLVGLSHRERL